VQPQLPAKLNMPRRSETSALRRHVVETGSSAIGQSPSSEESRSLESEFNQQLGHYGHYGATLLNAQITRRTALRSISCQRVRPDARQRASRVLLSSLQGAAITSIVIENVLHEFSSLVGVRAVGASCQLRFRQAQVIGYNRSM
jgi:hypothetical protein